MYSKISDKLFSDTGRMSRIQYAGYLSIAIIGFVAASSVSGLLYHILKIIWPDESIILVPPMLMIVAAWFTAVYSSVCITIKRFHDMDRSGWNFLWFIILIAASGHGIAADPRIMSLIYIAIVSGFVVLALIPGSKGTNRYDDENTTNQ